MLEVVEDQNALSLSQMATDAIGHRPARPVVDSEGPGDRSCYEEASTSGLALPELST
jgi:hypothetical protein